MLQDAEGRRVMGMILVVALFACAPASGGAARPASREPAATSQKPAAELARLEFLVGSWKTREKLLSGLAAPSGGESESSSELRWVLGGRYVRQDYLSHEAGVPFEGIGLLTYDPAKKKYRAWWFDAAGAADELDGNWEGADLVLTGDGFQSGAATKMRSTYHDIRPDRFIVTFEQSMAGSRMQKVFELTYTRKSAGSAGASAQAAEISPPKPAPELKKLGVFVGRWKTSETMDPSEYMPKGGKGVGTAEITWRLEGRFVHSTYSSSGPMGALEGIALMTYDIEKSAYRTWWFDSMGTGEEYRGNWEGERLVMTGLTTMMGREVRSRISYFDIKPDSYRFTYEDSTAGSPMKREIEIVYTRMK